MSSARNITRLLCVPVLLRPRVLALKNRWTTRQGMRSRGGRDFVVLLFSALIMFALYQGSLAALGGLRQNAHLAYLPPALPLGLLLMMLLGMLVFSNTVAALGALFLGRDLDLVLSAPVGRFRLYLAKLFDVASSSSWMAMVFGLPILAAFGREYGAAFDYYILALVVMLPYFLIPSALAIAIVTLFTRIVPVTHTRGLLLFIGIIAVGGLYYTVQLVSTFASRSTDLREILNIVALLSVPNRTWLPSHWAATSIGGYLSGSEISIAPYLILLYLSAIGIGAFSYIIFRTQHLCAYSASQSGGGRLRTRHSTKARKRRGIPLIRPAYWAMVTKEMKSFARDMTQALQLLLLIGLCLLYLYNFKLLHMVQGLPEGPRLWWQAVLVLLNLVMGAFVTTAVCTRFVYPSVSLEGRCYWLLQSSPLSLYEFVRVKFFIWWVPIAAISSVIFASGALAIDAEPHIVLINALAGWLICYGLVGLGVGMGALFADFEWENPSQLSASLGSLLYMCASILLIALNLLPVAALVFLRTLKQFGSSISPLEWDIYVALSAVLLVHINYAAARWALRSGARALERQRVG